MLYETALGPWFCLGAYEASDGVGGEPRKAGCEFHPLESPRLVLLLTILIIWFLIRISFVNRVLLL